MSLLVKALRQLDARQQASPPSVRSSDVEAIAASADEISAVAADTVETSVEPTVETQSPVAKRFDAANSYYPDPLAILSAIQSTEPGIVEPELSIETELSVVEPQLEIEIDESLFGFDSAAGNDSEIALLETVAAEPVPAKVEAELTMPVLEPLVPVYSLPDLEIAASYPTLSETSSEIAAEEFPALTTPTTESLLTEIDLTESTVVPVPSQRVETQIETALDRLDELRALISAGDISPELDTQDAPQLLPISATPAGTFHIREEFRELRDHLLARYQLQRGAAMMFVDAGRQTSDTSWLFPLAASLLQHFADSPSAEFAGRTPRILLVEAAGPECGLASSLGLESVAGLSDVLQSGASCNTAILPTWHPQIAMLGRGTEPLVGRQDRLPALFKELAESFDVLLIAAGPWANGLQNLSNETAPIPSAASLLTACVSAAVLCVELDGTPVPVAEAVKRNLAASGINLLGCVVQGDLAAA